MMFVLILMKLIIYTKGYDEGYLCMIDLLFNRSIASETINITTCQNYDKKPFYYRGRPTNIKGIINSTDINNYGEYKSVYIPEKQYLSNVALFPKSTIFFAHSDISDNSSDYNKDYCIISINHNLEEYKSLYYMIVGKNFDEFNNLLGYWLPIFFVFFIIYAFLLKCRFYDLKIKHQNYDIYNRNRLIIMLFGSFIISFAIILYIIIIYYIFYILHINLLFLLHYFF